MPRISLAWDMVEPSFRLMAAAVCLFFLLFFCLPALGPPPSHRLHGLRDRLPPLCCSITTSDTAVLRHAATASGGKLREGHASSGISTTWYIILWHLSGREDAAISLVYCGPTVQRRAASPLPYLALFAPLPHTPRPTLCDPLPHLTFPPTAHTCFHSFTVISTHKAVGVTVLAAPHRWLPPAGHVWLCAVLAVGKRQEQHEHVHLSHYFCHSFFLLEATFLPPYAPLPATTTPHTPPLPASAPLTLHAFSPAYPDSIPTPHPHTPHTHTHLLLCAFKCHRSPFYALPARRTHLRHCPPHTVVPATLAGTDLAGPFLLPPASLYNCCRRIYNHHAALWLGSGYTEHHIY